MKETWKSIEGYEGLYQISTQGRIKSLDRQILVKRGQSTFYQSYNKKTLSIHKVKNYFRVTLCKNGTCKLITIHRLLAITFIPNPEHKPDVNHKDGNKENNSISNLEWCDKFENMQHASSHNLLNLTYGENSHKAKLKEKDIMNIMELSKNQSQASIARIYGVGQSCIWKIVSGTKWKHRGK